MNIIHRIYVQYEYNTQNLCSLIRKVYETFVNILHELCNKILTYYHASSDK